MHAPRITLDQWKALVSVVESGGYAKAAASLHKSQSTLSYAIRKLEDLSGIKVFELRGRKSELTPDGELLYRRARALLEEAARVEHAATALARGWEPEIRFAVDVVFPTWLLLDCMGDFATEHPDIRIELTESVLGGTEEALAERRVGFAIGPRIPAGFIGDPLMRVRFVCAASPRHPLHQLDRALTLDDLRRHRHLVIRDSGAQRADTDASWLNETRWTMTYKSTSIRAALMGLGYAWYPEESVREELDAGRLKPLPLREGGERYTMLYLIFTDPDGSGPGTRRMAEIIRQNVYRRCPTGDTFAESSSQVEPKTVRSPP